MSVILAASLATNSITVPLVMAESGWYYMHMNFGSPQQPARIAFDSASAFLAVSSDICFNCST